MHLGPRDRTETPICTRTMCIYSSRTSLFNSALLRQQPCLAPSGQYANMYIRPRFITFGPGFGQHVRSASSYYVYVQPRLSQHVHQPWVTTFGPRLGYHVRSAPGSANLSDSAHYSRNVIMVLSATLIAVKRNWIIVNGSPWNESYGFSFVDLLLIVLILQPARWLFATFLGRLLHVLSSGWRLRSVGY